MLLYNEEFKLKVILDISEYWIICVLTHKTGKDITVGCVYIPPKKEYDVMLTQLFEVLQSYDLENLILRGDFNAHTANLTASPWHLNNNLSQHRKSRDIKINSRGKLLINE